MAEAAKDSTNDITLFCKSNVDGNALGDCPYTQKSLLCLSLHGLKFSKKFINLSAKPQSFLDLNKDKTYKLIAGDTWKTSTPAFQDNKTKTRIFDSSEIVKYLESEYKPSILSSNNTSIDKIPGAKTIFYPDLIELAKDIGQRNNGIINNKVNKNLYDTFKKSLSGIEGYLTELHLTNFGGSDIYINGTNKLCLTDIEFIPKLHAVIIHSKNALNIDICADKTDYKHIAKYMNYIYKQDWWIQNTYNNNDAFDIWREKFGLNSFDGKYSSDTKQIKEEKDDIKIDEKEEEKTDKNIGFYTIPDTPNKLYSYLCAAMSLELSTLPLYITALYSFKDDKIISATALNAKQLIREVIMEEMLHMNLLNNIISSIYGVSKVTTKFNIPYGKSCKLPANIRKDINGVQLKPYCKDVIYNTFIQIEAPTTLIQEHKPIINNDGSIHYPFEPKQGENSVCITFIKRDDVNQIGEFYNVICEGLKQLYNNKLITFISDDNEHKQRQCKSRKKETDSIKNLQDALDAIELICTQGEGYTLSEGVFGVVAKDINNDKNIENDVGTAEKTHFIKFIECLVGKELLSVKIEENKKDKITYKFIYGNQGKYMVDFDKEIYSMDNFKKIANDKMFNVYYKDMLEKLTDGLKKADITESVVAMRLLKDKFRQCMEKGVYPNFCVNDFPLPPLIGQIDSQ
eukprot:504273_1